MTETRDPHLQLAHWRRSVADLYGAVRQMAEPEQAWQIFLEGRNRLFRDHPQSPLDRAQRSGFSALPFYDYDPAFRTSGQLSFDFLPSEHHIDLGEDGAFHIRKIARIDFNAAGESASLSLYWVLGYGGGLFLPFRDATSRSLTYGGGRYLYDSIKGADLGAGGGEILLDFNFSYNPSCAYNQRWICPLAPPENHLEFEIRAGEKRFDMEAAF